MSQPIPQQIAAALGVLQDEADVWAASAGQLNEVSARAGSLRIDVALILYIWDEFLSVYNEVSDIVGARTAEGVLSTQAIAVALRQVGETYADEERRNLHTIHQLR